jgi:hypothetical protein
MRPQLILLTFTVLLAGSAAAWEFSPTPVCTLSHDGTSADVTVTYDPRLDLPYTILLARPGTRWPAAPTFALHFDGPRGLTISTDRHQLSNRGTTLSVSDGGFGNVLNGLAFSDTATAILGPETVPISLVDAAAPVAAFRACTTAGIA